MISEHRGRVASTLGTVSGRLRARRVPKSALCLSAALAIGCASRGHENEPPRASASAESPPLVSAAAHGEAPSVARSGGAFTSAEARPTQVATPETADPPAADFGAEARALYRAAACGSAGDVPRAVDAGLVSRHCATLRFIYDQYRKRWLSRAVPFMAAVRPQGLPPRVVYPFGGGDLFTALAVFPDAEEITTISLEPAGEVRGIEHVPAARLRDALAMNRRHLKKLLGLTYSKTTNLDIEGRGALPGEIVFLMAALVVHGFEPVSLRYFSIRDDGTLRFLTEDDFRALDRAMPRAPGHAPPLEFSNVEIAYKKVGSNDPPHVIRHISQDLSDKALETSGGLIRYLSSKGPVSAMTKAASHLLWADEFSLIRNYLLQNAVWMISDSTGIPPRFASAAGFVQDTFGKFDGPARYGPIEPRDAHDFRKLFAENPRRDLGFQFGYADVHRQIHLVVTRRAGTS